MTLKGGNTDELYKDDGRLKMAESLRDQHPDCVTVTERWGRWQHMVDYRQWRPKSQGGLGTNEPMLKPGVVIPDGADDYEMELVPVDRPERTCSVRACSTPSVKKLTPRGPSIWNLLQGSLAIDPGPSPTQPIKSFLTNSGSPLPMPEVIPGAAPEVALSKTTDELALALKVALASRGHRLLTRDGKFLVSEASKLTDDDRVQIKQYRDALIQLAEPWIDSPAPIPAADFSVSAPAVEVTYPPVHGAERSGAETSLFEAERPIQTLAQFLGTISLHADADYKPDEPPDLSGIDEVVLNFATNGLDWVHGSKPVGVTVSTLDGKLCRFLPFGFQYGGNLDEAAVKRWACEQFHGKKIYNANTRFDLHMSRAWGVDLEGQGCTFSDIQHTAALLDDHRKQFKLDKLAEDYLPGQPIVERVDEARHAEHHASEVAERERFTVQLVGKLVGAMYPELEKQELMDVQHLEDRVIPAVVEMEENGAPIDMELLEKYSAECKAKYDALIWEVTKECGFAFDHTAKGWQRLFEALGLPPTDGNAEAIIDTIDHPLVKKAHLAAQHASLNSKIFKSYKEKLRPDGILRFELNQLRNEDKGTVTGRFSAGLIQQVPNQHNHHAIFGDDLFPRRLYVPAKGHKYLAADAAQIQYRIFAHYACNPQVMAAYAADPWTNFHKLIMGKIQPHKPDMIYGHVKNMNFMRIFGGGLVKLAVMLGYITDDEGEEIRRARSQRTDPRLAKAREVEAIYRQEMPEVAPLLQKASHLAATKCNERCNTADALHRQFKHRGYVKTILGRRARFPNDYRLHKAFCMIDQGSEGDIVKTKICELHEARKQTGFLMRMTVHDEITGDACEPDTLARVDAILNSQSFPQLKVPILWECKDGANWAECK